MTNKKGTKRALLTSVLALVMCVSMLIGTTFAWFTDSVTSGTNIIAAGNLDVEVYNSLTVGENKVDSNTKLFDHITYWEPGVAAYENLTVANEGTLALKYQLSVIFDNATTNANGDTLAEVLKVGFVEGGIQSTTREGALAEVKTWLPLASFAQNGELLKGENDTYGIVIWWEPSDIDNEFNMNNDNKGKVMSIDLGIKLVATQKMHESDSFGKDYDALANAWDGSVGEVPEAVDNVLTITTGAELAAFAASVNGGNRYSGLTVKLGADINLGGHLWTPIGQTGATQFAGSFDGNGKTIYNLNIDNTANTSKYGAAGLFGWVEQHSGSNSIKNLTIDGVVINSHRYSGAVAGWINIPVTNCTVKNVTINCSYYNEDTDGTKVGALVGFADNKSALTGNTVDTAVLNAYGDVGGLAGVAQPTVSVDGNTVRNVVINYGTTIKSNPGELASTRATPVYGTNTIENVTFVDVIANTAELVEAINAGETDLVLAAGYFKLPNIHNKDITLNGVGTDTIVDYSHMGNYQEVSGSSFNFKNMTVQCAEKGYPYPGLQHTTSVSYENCHIKGTVNLFSDATFKNCTFNSGNGEHNVVTYGANNVTFENCKFTYGDRSVNCYAENASSRDVKVTFTNCEFTKVAGKATTGAIETNSSLMNSLTVTINNCSVNEGKLWFVADPWDSLEGAKTNVTVDGKVQVGTAKQLATAVAAGVTDIYLLDGEYNIYGCGGKTLTLSGSKNAVLLVTHEGEYGCDYGFDGSTVTFNGVTLDTKKANGQTWPNYARMNGTFNNCTFNGTYAPNRVNSFTGCTFNVTGNNYNLWLYGASTVSFEECTFNCDGKSIYVDGNGATGTDVTIKKCTFNDNGDGTAVNDKAAIETGKTYGQRYELIINETTVNGFVVNPTGLSTNSTLWANKHSMGTDVLNVVIDGVDVY